MKSISKNWFYVGLTKSDYVRLKQHNSGKVQSTKANKPYELVYKKEFLTRKQARNFEKFLKIRSNKEKLLIKLGYL